MSPTSHPLTDAIGPLVAAIGAVIVPADEIEEGDITLEWEGETAVGVRLEDVVSLDRLMANAEAQLGARLSELDRADKQRAVRMLDDWGAFQLRKSIEDVGEAMGVSRITIYNYLSAIKETTQ